MKQEDKFLITSLLFTLVGYVLYRVWKPEEKKPLAGPIVFNYPKKPVQFVDEFTTVDTERLAAMASLKENN